MTCLGWKGGIGTTSRLLDGHCLGALVMTISEHSNGCASMVRPSVGGLPNSVAMVNEKHRREVALW